VAENKDTKATESKEKDEQKEKEDGATRASSKAADAKMVKVVALKHGIVCHGATCDGEAVSELPVGKVSAVPVETFKRALAPYAGLVTTPAAYDAKKKAQAAHEQAMAEFEAHGAGLVASDEE
jgi:hypothetical protein